MDRRQRSIIIELLVVIVITAAAVVAMVDFKNYVNRSEAMQAMQQLGEVLLRYRTSQGAVPPESYIDTIKEKLPGYVRLGNLRYRARWINLGAEPDEILAYVKKDYNSLFFASGYIVLRLDGRVEWMQPNQFEPLLAKQQSPEEIRETKK